MAIPKAYIIARWVANDASNVELRGIFEVITDVLPKYLPDYSTEKISELTEILIVEIAEELKNYHADCLDDGIIPRFEILGEGRDLYIKIIDTPENILLEQLKKTTAEQFESFCAELLKKLSALSHRTGSNEDGGVDFVGYGLPFSTDNGPAPRGSKAIVIGQSKRFKDGNFVSETDVRKFIGGAINQAHNIKKASQDIGALTPIVYAFWTTSEFCPTAKEYSKNMGLWFLNGIGLAQLAYRLGVREILGIE